MKSNMMYIKMYKICQPDTLSEDRFMCTVNQFGLQFILEAIKKYFMDYRLDFNQDWQN